MKSLHPLLALIAGAAILLAAAGIVSLSLLWDDAAAAPQIPDAPQVQFTTPQSPPNATVEGLVEGILEARRQQDRAWLAGALARMANKATPSDEDLHAAYRGFLWDSMDRFWARIDKAWKDETYAVQQDSDSARVVFKTGGALGEVALNFERHNDCWYLSEQ